MIRFLQSSLNSSPLIELICCLGNSASERALTIHHPSDVINCTTQLKLAQPLPPSPPPPAFPSPSAPRLHLLADIRSCDLLRSRRAPQKQILNYQTLSYQSVKNRCEREAWLHTSSSFFFFSQFNSCKPLVTGPKTRNGSELSEWNSITSAVFLSIYETFIHNVFSFSVKKALRVVDV